MMDMESRIMDSMESRVMDSMESRVMDSMEGKTMANKDHRRAEDQITANKDLLNELDLI